MIQLAGHLRGHALLEWNLLSEDDRNTYKKASDVLLARLDPGNKTLAAQDFCHAAQHQDESVPDFLRRLERIFESRMEQMG